MQVLSVKFTWSSKKVKVLIIYQNVLFLMFLLFLLLHSIWVLHFTYYIHIIWDHYIRVAAIYRFQHTPWYENWCLVSYPVNLFISSNEFYQCSVIKNINISSLCQLPYISGHNMLCNYNKASVQTLLFWFL